MAAKKKKEKVFNDRDRKVFRNYIGRNELWFGLVFIAFVGLMGWWFVEKKDAYDPGERDISMEVLVAQQVEDNLYKAPLIRWRDPSVEAAVVGETAGSDLGPIPSEMASNGWIDSSRLQEFNWDNLYEKINGAEVQYKSYGFVAAWFLGLSNEANGWDMNIEIYDMTSFTNALGLFWAQRGDSNPEVVHEGKAYYYLTEIGAIGIAENYYFKLAANTSDPGIIEHAKLFVRKFEPSVEAKEPPPAIYSKLRKHLEFDQIGYAREDAFQYDFCKNFWFGKPEREANLKFFIHEAASEEDAKSLYDQFAEEQSYEYKEVSREGNRVLYEHEFLKTIFILAQDGNVIYGIDGAESQEKAAATMAKVERIVHEDAA